MFGRSLRGRLQLDARHRFGIWRRPDETRMADRSIDRTDRVAEFLVAGRSLFLGAARGACAGEQAWLVVTSTLVGVRDATIAPARIDTWLARLRHARGAHLSRAADTFIESLQWSQCSRLDAAAIQTRAGNVVVAQGSGGGVARPMMRRRSSRSPPAIQAATAGLW
jgi:hypothetical protein